MVRIAGRTCSQFGLDPARTVLGILMDRISRHSLVGEGVRFGGLRIPSLLFEDDMVHLVASNSDFQVALGRFAAEVEGDEDQHS